MKKYTLFLAICILATLVCFMFQTWWLIAVVAFVLALFIPSKFPFLQSFFAGFLCFGLLTFFYSFNNQHLLASKFAQLFFSNSNPYLLILFTALFGGIVAGLAGKSASYFKI